MKPSYLRPRLRQRETTPTDNSKITAYSEGRYCTVQMNIFTSDLPRRINCFFSFTFKGARNPAKHTTPLQQSITRREETTDLMSEVMKQREHTGSECKQTTNLTTLVTGDPPVQRPCQVSRLYQHMDSAATFTSSALHHLLLYLFTNSVTYLLLSFTSHIRYLFCLTYLKQQLCIK